MNRLGVPNTDIKAFFGSTDNERLYQRTIIHQPTQRRYTQWSLYKGDAELGAIFLEGTERIVASIGDGRVEECTQF